MFCCKFDDLAGELKKTAMEEIRQKHILGNAYILTRSANPYSAKNMVITEKRGRNIIEIYWQGKPVFLWRFGLRQYTCGDWSDKLALEVRAMKANKCASKAQVFANNYALKNYTICK